MISSSRDRWLSLNAFVYCFESVEKYSDGKIHNSEPELRNGGNVNTVYFYSSGEIFKSVAQSLFTINKYMMANVCFYLCLQIKIIYVKNIYFYKLAFILEH